MSIDTAVLRALRMAPAALVLAVAPAKAQFSINTNQSGNLYSFDINNLFAPVSGSSASLSQFTIPVFDYKLGSASFVSGGDGWFLSGITAIGYNGGTNNGYSLTFASPDSDLNLQPSNSMTLVLQTNNSAALTTQTASFQTEAGGSYTYNSFQSPGIGSPIPEPSTYGLIMISACSAAVAFERYRRRKRELAAANDPLKGDGKSKYF